MTKPSTTFFMALAYSMKHIISDDVPTAATNGKLIKYNPNFLLKLNLEEQVFLMLHETMHIAYMHMARAEAQGLDPYKANIAADHVINLQLIGQGFTMPKGGLADNQYSGMSMEEIYALLPPNSELPWDDLGKPQEGEAAESLKAEIEEALVRAAMQSKMAGDKPGTIPGDIEIFLDRLLNPKLPWQTILRKYFQNFSKSDYSWKKPNRRFFPKHYLPSVHSESLMEIAVAIDVSGSVSDAQFQQHISEVASIIKTMMPPKITLIQFDHIIQSVDAVSSMNDLMNVSFTGRGGTNIDPVLEKCNELKPEVLLVFTDGWFHPPQIQPKSNVLWMVHDNPAWTAPFGKAIHYTLANKT